MKIKGADNTPDEDEKIFSKQIKSILEASNSGEEALSMREKVSDLLDGEDKRKAKMLLKEDIGLFQYLPESLKNDEEIVEIVLKKDPKKYVFFSIKLRQNTKIQEITIDSIISGLGDVFDLIEVLKTSKKRNQKLEGFADECITKNKGFFPNDSSRLFYDIFKTERKIFDQIITAGLITSSHSGIALGEKTARFLAKIMPELEGISPEESQKKLFSAILRFLSLSEKNIGTSSKLFLEALVSTISITQKQEEEDEDNEELSSEHLHSKDEEEDEIDLSVGPYNYIPLGNTCRVWDNHGSSVTIEKPIFNNMSTKSLENFMNFSKLMKNLGLDFLITKQQRLSQLVTGVNFYQEEGMSEGRTLKFLNSVGKNIGEPEESYQDAEGNRKTGCFDTLSAAKMKFREIKSAGKIGEFDIDVSKTGDKSVVEIYMKHIGLLGEPFGELSIAKWKK